MGNARKMVKSLNIAGDKRGHLLILSPAGKKPPAVAQSHDEKMDFPVLAPNHTPALPPIYLSLPTRWRLKTYRGFSLNLLPPGPDISLYRLITPL